MTFAAPQQKMLLSNYLFAPILDKTKDGTLRKGDRNIAKGSLLILPSTLSEHAPAPLVVEVSEVIKHRFDETSQRMLALEGVETIEELRAYMATWYGPLPDDTPMTSSFWKAVREANAAEIAGAETILAI